MAPGKPCRHLGSQGCTIYADRPQKPCRTFQCAWLRRGSPLPDDLRPDRCGAIVLADRDYLGWKVWIATPTGWKIPKNTLRKLMRLAREQSMPLIYIENFHENGEYTHFSRSGYGPRDFVEAITRDTSALDLKQI